MRFKKNWKGTMAAACVVAVSMSATAAAQPATGAKPDTVTAAVPANQLKPQTTCPVTGDPIVKTHFVDYKEKRIYLCCQDCVAQVKKDPEKYIRKLEGMGQSVEVTGREAKGAAVDTSATKMQMKNMVATADSGAGKKQVKNMKMAGDTASPAADADYWTCPMHPAVHKAGAGACPICGMNLVHKKGASAVKK